MIRLVFIALCVSFAIAKPSQELPKLSDEAKAIFIIESHKLEAQNGRIYNIYIARLRENVGDLARESRDSAQDSARESNKNSQTTNLTQDSRKIFYTLDGNAFFPQLLNLIAKNPNAFHALPLIVGIGHHSDLAFDRTLRTMDYLPKVDENLAKQFSGSGGDEAFLAFILERVKPYVRKTSHCEAIFGHSFGGIFVLNALVRAQNAFDYFIIASPSLWWGLGRDIAKLAQNPPEIRANVLFTRGSLEKNAQNRTSEISLENLISALRSHATSADLIDFIEFSGASHGQSAPLSILEALKRFSFLNCDLIESRF